MNFAHFRFSAPILRRIPGEEHHVEPDFEIESVSNEELSEEMLMIDIPD